MVVQDIKLSTPSFEITVKDLREGIAGIGEFFQLPLSGSLDSENISVVPRRSIINFQLPLSGSPRDH
jgi:hypothetical protein